MANNDKIMEKNNSVNTLKTDKKEQLKKDLAVAAGIIKDNPSKKGKDKKNKKRKLRPWVIIVFICICLGGLIYGSYALFLHHKDSTKLDELSKEIEKDIKVKKVNEDGELVNPPEDKNNDYWNYIKVPFYNVDINTLIDKNNDTVGFIHMDNTNINYPVVHSGDNEYYLTHAFDKTKNSAGWVFMDYRNDPATLSDNTIIYGHGRVNGTVFGSLNKVLTKSWQNNKDNYIIWLSTKTENLVWQIFSVYTIEAESYYIKANFENDVEKEKWIKTMKERNQAPQSADVSVNDYFLTLSTCKNNFNTRIVVQAKLIKRQKK